MLGVRHGVHAPRHTAPDGRGGHLVQSIQRNQKTHAEGIGFFFNQCMEKIAGLILTLHFHYNWLDSFLIFVKNIQT